MCTGKIVHNSFISVISGITSRNTDDIAIYSALAVLRAIFVWRHQPSRLMVCIGYYKTSVWHTVICISGSCYIPATCKVYINIKFYTHRFIRFIDDASVFSVCKISAKTCGCLFMTKSVVSRLLVLRNTCLVGARVGADYEKAMKSKLWIYFSFKWRINWQEKECASRRFLRYVICLTVSFWDEKDGYFSIVPRSMHEMCMRREYVCIPNPLDLVYMYAFLQEYLWIQKIFCLMAH